MEKYNLTFGEAIELLKEGKLVTRAGWNGKGMFIFKRPKDELPINFLLGVKSLPKGVKDYYEHKYQPIVPDNIPKISFTDFLCIKAVDDTIISGWVPSQSDMLAKDWGVFEI